MENKRQRKYQKIYSSIDRKSYLQNSKMNGITLIALVVTIVVLLILAGITLNLLFANTGIFNKAQQSEDQFKIGALKDQISTIILDWELEKKIPNTTGDETIGTLDRLWDKFVDADIIDDPEEDIYHQEGTDIYEVTTNEGYVVEIIVKEDGTVEIGDIVKGDSLPPRIGEITSNGTSNSIHVEVNITRSTGEVSLSYYYKKEGEAEESYIPLKENVEDLTADFTGLEQNVVYNIKVIVTDDNGSVEKTINERTGELTKATIEQAGDLEWNNGLATIKLQIGEGIELASGEKLVYQIGDLDGEWLLYPEEGISGLNHGDIVYAAISDGTNVSKESSFEIKDGIAPTVTITQGTITTKSIAVSVSATDREWGMPEPPTYNYYIKKSTENSYPSTASYTGTNTSYTFDNLSQTTSYDIKVTTVDKAGNEGSKELTGVSTGTIGGATGNLVSGNIIASNPTWSGGKASITLSKGSGVASNLSIEWQKGSITGAWTTGTSVTGLNHNDIVYARLTDGVNAGSHASVTIKDGTAPNAPTISITSGTKGNNNYYKSNVTVSITAGSDGQSGANQVRYSVSGAQTVNQTTTAAGTTTASITITAEGTSTITAYTLDKAGNVSTASTQTINKDSTAPSTASITVGTVAETSIAVTARGADATSGIYSYQFQRSTTSATSGFTTVATQTSSATSYSYTYTGLTEGTTYYLRVIVTDRAGNTRTGTAVTQATTYPAVESVLKEGDWVNYVDKNGTTRKCIVLYGPENANYTSYGIQIITSSTVGTMELGGDYFEAGKSSYNSAIMLLNNRASNYLNTTYASDARCVGSVPNNKNSQAGTILVGTDEHVMRNSDTNYRTDYNQMTSLGILRTNSNYWLASRYVSRSEWNYFYIRSVGSGGDLVNNDERFCGISNLTAVYSYDPITKGFRPVFTLKPGIKVTGGSGTINDPYTLGA